MKILVCGAGVVGSVYAARLKEAGHDVTVLARSIRMATIETNGLMIQNAVTQLQSTTPVLLTRRLGPFDQFDVALIAVRRDQLADLIPDLKANRTIPTFLFLQNNPLGTAELFTELGRDRVVLGFPGVGGAFDGQIVRYAVIPQQPTTIGTQDGRNGLRSTTLLRVFKNAGFPSRTERQMDAWLKAHAFFITAIGGALGLAGGNCLQLARDKSTLALMVTGVREGFAAMRSLGIPVRPSSLNILFCWMPLAFAVWYWRRFFLSPIADLVLGSHARSASFEICALADDCRALLRKSGVCSPSLLQLYRVIDSHGFSMKSSAANVR